MIKVGDIVRVKERQNKIAEGQKVILRARISFITETGYEFANGCIIQIHNGYEFKHTDLKRIKIIEMDKEIDPDDKIMFIPEFQLEPFDHNDDSIIVKGFYTKWNVYMTDWYNNYRKEYKEKYGHDIHNLIYK